MDKPLRNPLILIVDDTEATRYTVSRILRREGYETIEAANGADGLRLAKECSPQLVVLDIHLPDMSGFDVCKKLKTEIATSAIPVLQISASYVTSKDRIHGLEGGADSYLTHPVEPPVLAATVKSLLRFRTVNQELRASEERYRKLSDVVPQLVWECDSQGEMLFFNSRWYEFTGLTDERSLGKRWLEALHPDDRKGFIDAWEIAVRAGDLFEFQCRLRSHSGGFRWMLFQALPHQNAFERTAGWIGTCTNIHEQIELQLELKNAKASAEDANRAKTQFLANMSHEIRTPLGIVLGFTDLALELSELPAEAAQYLSKIRTNGEQLLNLIGDILDLSKVEANHLELESVEIPLRDFMHDMVMAMSPMARAKDLAMKLDTSSTLPSLIQADPTKLRQILQNLISNAVKFTEKGEIALKVYLSPEGMIHFEVSDSGIGISEAQISRLFQPFSQADSSMSRRFGGTGLGLALSQRLARAMGGDIVVLRSDISVGTTFLLSIANDSTVKRERGRWSPNSKQSIQGAQGIIGRKILLIEDSVDNQLLISRILAQSGASIEVANNGEQGVERALQGNYDAVLMDIQMPVMDGYKATKSLRASGFQKPILALTAHAMSEERDRALSSGFDGYLTKPVSRSALISSLSNFF